MTLLLRSVFHMLLLWMAISSHFLTDAFSTFPNSNINSRAHALSASSSSSSTTKSSKNQLQYLEAILWDMDGVLADTERDAHRPAFNQVFQQEGLDTEWTEERYGKLLEVGGGKERMTAHWNEVGWPAALQSMTDDQRQVKVKELHLRKTDVFMGLINQGDVPLRPGVIRVIDSAIEAGLTLAVCSTSNELAVRNLVQTLMGPERAAKFSIFAGDMVAKKKPAPDVYLMAVEQLGLDKSRCVIVEDSAIGLGAAKAAGITCIVTKSSYTAGEDFTGADKIVEELGDDPATGVTLETLDGLLIAKNNS
ncbi:HAD superfamily hydrolase [Nitzschia inconspicua]|uniref:HAD superfamily hydrolase n=1 Tax=Nitzschia inconspicua TaxID=303405 RepID=A0A9K3KMA0_9STRA|nr:HAD superfamily hydrolase [Nitzschia inconspicua]